MGRTLFYVASLINLSTMSGFGQLGLIPTRRLNRNDGIEKLCDVYYTPPVTNGHVLTKVGNGLGGYAIWTNAEGITGPAGLTGATGATGPAGGSGLIEFAGFFGMPAGPGNAGTDDYPATIAISAAEPSVAAGSAVNFPRLMAPIVGGITIHDPGVAQSDNTEFRLPSVGTYSIRWHINVDEPGQMSLMIGDAPDQAPGGTFTRYTTALGTPGDVGRATGTSNIEGDLLVQTTSPGQIIQVRNYRSAAALTIHPVPGGTQAQAVVLIIERLA